MPRFVPFLLGTLMAAMLVAVPVGFAHYRRNNVPLGRRALCPTFFLELASLVN